MNIASVKRNYVLIDTLKRLYAEPERERLRAVALANAKRWKEELEVAEGKVTSNETRLKIEVVPDDWGVATQQASKKYGAVFACLNMANTHVFGGGYLHGMAAQEENMFRRTDCHFSHRKNLKQSKEVPLEKLQTLPERHYKRQEWELIDGLNADLGTREGRVYLDMTPRICIKGHDDRELEDLGYALLPEDEIFPFYELRSAALDLREGAQGAYDIHSLKRSKNPTGVKERKEPWGMRAMRMKIRAQLATLRTNGVRHAVLSAFGCGAFLNPAECVARIYSEEIQKVKTDFDVIVFAVFYPGYGHDNYSPFWEEFQAFE